MTVEAGAPTAALFASAGGLAAALAARIAVGGQALERAGVVRASSEGDRRVGLLSVATGLRRSSFAGLAVSATLGWVFFGPLAAIPAVIGGHLALRAIRRHRMLRASAALDQQLADAVRTMASGLRAGLSVTQSLRYAADEAELPLAASLVAVVDDVDVGTKLGDALERWADLVGSDDARLVVGVLRLHRRSGGDLPRVLDQLADTLRDRHAAAREVRALTAQARLSGVILGLLPVGFFLFLWLTSRRDIEGAFRTPAGLTSLALGAGLEAIAFYWIRRLLEVR
jgi:tight adherence protein B